MNNSYNGHLCIVFALEHYNPLNMIRAFGENGINPVYISVKRRYEVATRSKYISKLHRVDSVEEGFELLMKEYGNLAAETGKKPYIVFSDDKSVGYFDLHYEEWKDKVIYFGPMSCRTGFYLILAGDYESEDIVPMLREMYKYISQYEGDVPGASAEECGNYLDMNLPMARFLADRYLEKVLIGITPDRLNYPK